MKQWKIKYLSCRNQYSAVMFLNFYGVMCIELKAAKQPQHFALDMEYYVIYQYAPFTFSGNTAARKGSLMPPTFHPRFFPRSGPTWRVTPKRSHPSARLPKKPQEEDPRHLHWIPKLKRYSVLSVMKSRYRASSIRRPQHQVQLFNLEHQMTSQCLKLSKSTITSGIRLPVVMSHLRKFI